MHLRNTATAQPIPITSDWLGSLSNFIKSLKSCEFDTVDALLAAVAYDEPAAGLMLKRVLHWHSSKSGGEFHLSQRDWWRQCRVNRKTIERVKAKIFPLCGITVEVKSTTHGKATYYRLHETKFMRRLAQVINFPLVFVVNRLCPKGTDGCVQKGQMGVSESDAPLTIESTIKTSNDVVKNTVVPSVKVVDFKSHLPESTPEQLRVIDLLKKAHVPGQRAVSFALLPETIVRDCIASAQSAFDAKRTKNRVGYLIGALRKQLAVFNAQPVSVPQVTTEPETISDSHQTNFAATLNTNSGILPSESFGDYIRRLEAEAAQAKASEPVNERLTVRVNDKGSMTVHDAWSAAYNQLSLQLDRASFDTWLHAAVLLDYEADEKKFVVGVHNSYARDMLQHRLYRNVARILRDVTGIEVAIRFEVHKGGKVLSPDEIESHDAPLRRFLRSNDDAN